MFSHCRFLRLLVSDVRSVAIDPDVQGILGRSNVLLSALLAPYRVYSALGLAGSRCAHLVRFLGDSTLKPVSGFDMSAGLTAFGVAWPVSILPGSFSDGKRNNAAK